MPIAYSAVRVKEAGLRVSVLASHEKEHLDRLVYALCAIKNDIDIK